MKNEIKKKPNYIKKKAQIPFSDSKTMKTKKDYTINKNSYCDNKNQIKITKNKPNHNIISQTGTKKKIKSHQNINNQSRFLLPQNLDNQIDADHNEKTENNIQTSTHVGKNCLKSKLMFTVNYILNAIKNIF